MHSKTRFLFTASMDVDPDKEAHTNYVVWRRRPLLT